MSSDRRELTATLRDRVSELGHYPAFSISKYNLIKFPSLTKPTKKEKEKKLVVVLRQIFKAEQDKGRLSR